MAEQIINVMLVDNALTPEAGDFTGRVQLNGTLYNQQIAQSIVNQRTELRYETILSVLNMADEIKRISIATGHSVIDGVSQMRPSITGNFIGANAKFNPDVHSKGVSMSPSPEMRKAMAASKVVVLGASTVGPVINKVEDMYTSTENGIITPGRNLRIYGQRLRIAGEDMTVNGVWFIAAGTSERIRLDDRDLVDNDPSKLTLIIPNLAPGGYFLEIVTQSSSVAKQLVKEPRTYRFEIMLTVEGTGGVKPPKT
jgi:hypothetical protein